MRVATLLSSLSGLAVAAAAAAAAQTKVPISQATYDDLIYYAAYAEAAYTAPCAHPPHAATALAYISINATDTQATLFKDPARRQLVLAIPGTASLQDLLTDVTFLPLPYVQPGIDCTACAVHAGFLLSWQSADKQARDAISAALKSDPDYAVVVAAHSLGGALAQLAFASLSSAGQGLTPRAVYTYGQPRVGNQAFADYTDKLAGSSDTGMGRYFRTTHADDGVPQLPPTYLGFRHPRTEYWEQNDATGKPSLASTSRCFGQEPADCNDGAGGQGINAAHGSYAGFDAGRMCNA